MWIEQKLRLHLLPRFGTQQVRNVTTGDIRQYVAKRKADGAENGTINRELSILKRTFRLATKSTPAKLTNIPAVPKLAENNVRQGFFRHDEFLLLRSAMESGAVKALVTIAFQTGMRRGELLSLKWSQVDITAKELRLASGDTKNRAPRAIPLTTEATDLLAFLKLSGGNGNQQHVFLDEDGEALKSLNAPWKAACKKVGMWDEVTKKPTKLFHDLRRTGVRNLVRSGTPERVAMAISGHKTRSVFDRYNIVSTEDLKSAMNRLETVDPKSVEDASVERGCTQDAHKSESVQ